ncbi:ABC transporter permease [Paenibacillus sp. QZ-Y1]|uniref:ABC transporter permease n=1 Tax=Paenibacillus sp. QZ-Y1 TaxID=3414511 RepID=UPI003F78F1ED
MIVISAIRNEVTKLAGQRSTWIIYSCTLLIMISTAILQHIAGKIEISSYWDYAVSLSQTSIQLYSLFAVLLSIQLIQVELSTGSIRLLLVHPCTRSKIWFAKFIAALLFSLGGYAAIVMLAPLLALLLSSSEGIAKFDQMIRFFTVSASRLPDYPIAIASAFTMIMLTRNMGFALIFSLIVTITSANILLFISEFSSWMAAGFWLIFLAVITIPGWKDFIRQEF